MICSFILAGATLAVLTLSGTAFAQQNWVVIDIR